VVVVVVVSAFAVRTPSCVVITILVVMVLVLVGPVAGPLVVFCVPPFFDTVVCGVILSVFVVIY